MIRQEYVIAIKQQFANLKGRQIVYGELQFLRGVCVGQGAYLEEVDLVLNEMHFSGDLPNIFDMIDDQNRELLRAKGVVDVQG
jgi:hypothetical protein